MNERQKADHFDSQLKLVQNPNRQLEARNEELEAKFSSISTANLELQRVERELRDQLVDSIPQHDFEEVKKKLEVRLIRLHNKHWKCEPHCGQILMLLCILE